MNRVLRSSRETQGDYLEIEQEIAAGTIQNSQKLEKFKRSIADKILPVVNASAERAAFNLVFDSSGNSINGVPVLVFARHLPDLTDAVLKEHDRSR